MQPFPPVFVMTFIRLVIPSVYTRPSVWKSNISEMTYWCHYQNKRRDTRKAVAKSRKMLVAEFLRRSENSNELPGKNGQIKGRENFSLTHTMQDIYRKFGLEFNDIKMSFTAFCRGRPSNIKLSDTCASITPTCPRRRPPPKYCQSPYLN